MNRLKAVMVAAGLASLSVQGALVTYNLSGTGSGGTVATGTFSYDTDVIGVNAFNIEAYDDFTTYSVTLTSIPGGGPTSTTFTKGVDLPGSLFVIFTDANGVITDLNPGFADNADGYSLSPQTTYIGNLNLSGVGTVDTMTWSYSAVPEMGPMAVATGVGLLGFLTVRHRSRSGPGSRI